MERKLALQQWVKRGLWCTAAGFAVGAAGLGAWWGVLLHRSRLLFDQSRLFPTSYVVGDPARPSKRYLVMGDSTAVGTGASRLETTFPYQCAEQIASGGFCVHVVNIARTGARVADVLRDQAPQIAKQKPDFITISAGANDATHFTSADEYASAWRPLLAALTASRARVLIANTPDMTVVPALPPGIAQLVGRRAAEQNRCLGTLTRGAAVTTVDLFHDGKLDPRVDPHYYAADLFHPADHGYAVWSGLFRRALLSVVRPARTGRQKTDAAGD